MNSWVISAAGEVVHMCKMSTEAEDIYNSPH